MIVDGRVLPGLVRATAINASRAKRSMLTYYQNHYEERSRALDSLIKNHKDNSTFEDFVTNVYSPKNLSTLFQYSGTSRPTSLLGSTSLGSQQLSAQLSGNGFDVQPQQNVFSNSTRELRPPPRSNKLDLGHTLSTPNMNNNNNGGNFGTFIEEEVSPRGGKKLSFKPSPGLSASSAGPKRPLTIKEEPGLPNQPSPTSAMPPRRR